MLTGRSKNMDWSAWLSHLNPIGHPWMNMRKGVRADKPKYNICKNYGKVTKTPWHLWYTPL